MNTKKTILIGFGLMLVIVGALLATEWLQTYRASQKMKAAAAAAAAAEAAAAPDADTAA